MDRGAQQQEQRPFADLICREGHPCSRSQDVISQPVQVAEKHAGDGKAKQHYTRLTLFPPEEPKRPDQYKNQHGSLDQIEDDLHVHLCSCSFCFSDFQRVHSSVTQMPSANARTPTAT